MITLPSSNWFCISGAICKHNANVYLILSVAFATLDNSFQVCDLLFSLFLNGRKGFATSLACALPEVLEGKPSHRWLMSRFFLWLVGNQGAFNKPFSVRLQSAKAGSSLEIIELQKNTCTAPHFLRPWQSHLRWNAHRQPGCSPATLYFEGKWLDKEGKWHMPVVGWSNACDKMWHSHEQWLPEITLAKKLVKVTQQPSESGKILELYANNPAS